MFFKKRSGVLSICLALVAFMPLVELYLLSELGWLEDSWMTKAALIALVPLMFYGIYASGWSYPYGDPFSRGAAMFLGPLLLLVGVAVFASTIAIAGPIATLMVPLAMTALCVGTIGALAYHGARKEAARS